MFPMLQKYLLKKGSAYEVKFILQQAFIFSGRLVCTAPTPSTC